MQHLQPIPPAAQCACGRPADDATVTMFRSLRGTYRFHRCACGMEWTEHDVCPEPSAAVAGDEVIEVHEQLKAFHGTLRNLLGVKAA